MKLVSIAPNDKNVQALLISINQSIEDKGLDVPNEEPEASTESDEMLIEQSDNTPAF